MRNAPYRGVVRIALDLGVWAAAATLCPRGLLPHLLVALFIGAVPMHDLLLQGHEGNHRMLSRVRWVNEVLTWFTHAIIGLSHTAHRAFHLEHHRRAHTPQDPEVVFLDSLIAGIPGRAYLRIPTRVHWAVNTWPLSHRSREASAGTVLRDLVLALILHLLTLRGLGLEAYTWFVIVPAATGFPLAFGIRSILRTSLHRRGQSLDQFLPHADFGPGGVLMVQRELPSRTSPVSHRALPPVAGPATPAGGRVRPCPGSGQSRLPAHRVAPAAGAGTLPIGLCALCSRW